MFCRLLPKSLGLVLFSRDSQVTKHTNFFFCLRPVCWYLVHCQMHTCSYSTLILACRNYLLTKNSTKNNNTLFFIVKGFFLKTKFIAALMIAVNLDLFNSIHCCFVYLHFHWTFYHALVPWKKKKTRMTCYLFLLSFVRFKYYCFCLQWIKTKPYSANKSTDFCRFLSFLEFLGLF